MAATSRQGQSPASRKIAWLAAAVLIICVLYTAAWFYIAGEIRSRLTMLMSGRQGSGLTIECGGMDIRGFPFRFELFCSKPGLANLDRGGSAEAEALRSAAQVYAPWHIVWEADGPLSATLSSGERLRLNWQSLQSSLQLKSKGLERSSIAADGLELVMPPDGAVGVFNAKAGHAEAHLRQNGEDLDSAVLMRDVALTPPGTPTLPLFSASLDATLAGKAGAMEGRIRGNDLLRPGKGEIRRFVVDFGSGRVTTLSGPFDIDEEGRISGKFSVEAEKFVEWRPLLEDALPDEANSIATAMGAIKGMADDKGTVRINLVLEKGQLLLGFIPLGIEIPPIR
jgi:hypothetical protein